MTVALHTHLAFEFPNLVESLSTRLHAARHALRVADSKKDLLELLGGAEVVVSGPLSSDELDRAESLELHVIPFAGVNRCPLDWYANRDVILANSHGNARVVAERTVALLLAAAGRVVEFDGDLRRGKWHRYDDRARPFDYWRSLSGKTVALLGVGAIGLVVAEFLRPLVGRIVGFGLSNRDGAFSTALDAYTTDIYDATRGAAAVVCSLPSTPATRGLVDRSVFEHTDHAVFVNVSRADVVVEGDLYRSLQDGTLGAGGIDVWPNHPDPPSWEVMPSSLPFRDIANVVMSPHAASHTIEGKRSQLVDAISAVDEFLAGRTPTSAINLSRGY